MNESLTKGLLLCLVFSGAMIMVSVPLLLGYEYQRVYRVTLMTTSQAVLLPAGLAVLVGILTLRSGVYGIFLTQLFMAGLLARQLVGAAIFSFSVQEFFGGDAYTYDYYGYLQTQAWHGDQYAGYVIGDYIARPAAAWGMIYYVAAIYEVVGRNMLAVQMVNAVLGAATAPMIFHCSYNIAQNWKAARWAALGVAFLPSLVLWSSQGLKDGPVMFLLALAILATLKLAEEMKPRYVVALLLSLVGVLAFRFYLFYMMLLAVGGSFFVMKGSSTSLIRRFVLILLLGPVIAYVMSTRHISEQFNQFASLEAVQTSRSEASTYESGFAKDADVSTTAGSLKVIPIGLAVLLLAPFPWQLGSLRQVIALPEMVVWWASLPALVIGLAQAIRYRLRHASPIMIFTAILSLAYSVFQGNIGNAYRQRAQLLIFYLIFVAMGWVVLRGQTRQSISPKSTS